MSDQLSLPYADVLPPLATRERDALEADVRAEGVHAPVLVTEDGVLLDGHNRYAIEPAAPRKVLPGSKNWTDAHRRAFVLGTATKTRNLSSEQQRDLDAKRREVARELKSEGWTQEQVGVVLGVARETIRDWLGGNNGGAANASTLDARVKVSRPARVKAAERVAAGEPIGQVASDLGVTDRRVRQIVAQGEKEQRHRAALKTGRSGVVDVRLCTADELLAEIASESVDLLLTDPPYMTDVEDVRAFAAWAPDALLKVKRTGHAYIFTGSYPEELAAYLETLLSLDGWRVDGPLVWVYNNTIGPSTKQTYRRNWQACWHLQTDKSAPLNTVELTELFAAQTINAPDARGGVRLHAWEKPMVLAEMLVRHGSQEGGLVLDPFLGTGTFAAAATRLGRDIIGCDQDEQMTAFWSERGLA